MVKIWQLATVHAQELPQLSRQPMFSLSPGWSLPSLSTLLRSHPPFPHLCPPCKGGPLTAVTVLPAGKAETPLGGSQGCSLFHTWRTKERWVVQKKRQQLSSLRSNAESWTSWCWAQMNSTRSVSWLSGVLGSLSLALLEINLFFLPLRTGNSVDASQSDSKQ